MLVPADSLSARRRELGNVTLDVSAGVRRVALSIHVPAPEASIVIATLSHVGATTTLFDRDDVPHTESPSSGAEEWVEAAGMVQLENVVALDVGLFALSLASGSASHSVLVLPGAGAHAESSGAVGQQPVLGVRLNRYHVPPSLGDDSSRLLVAIAVTLPYPVVLDLRLAFLQAAMRLRDAFAGTDDGVAAAIAAPTAASALLPPVEAAGIPTVAYTLHVAPLVVRLSIDPQGAVIPLTLLPSLGHREHSGGGAAVGGAAASVGVHLPWLGTSDASGIALMPVSDLTITLQPVHLDDVEEPALAAAIIAAYAAQLTEANVRGMLYKVPGAVLPGAAAATEMAAAVWENTLRAATTVAAAGAETASAAGAHADAVLTGAARLADPASGRETAVAAAEGAARWMESVLSRLGSAGAALFARANGAGGAPGAAAATSAAAEVHRRTHDDSDWTEVTGTGETRTDGDA